MPYKTIYMPNFDEILIELSYRVESGIVDLTNKAQLSVLEDILRETGVTNINELVEKARVYYSYLDEAVTYKAVSKKSGKIVKFTNRDNYQAAIEDRTHFDVKSKEGKEILKKGGEEKSTKNKAATGASVYGAGVGASVFPTDKKQKKEKAYKQTESQVKIFKGRKKVLLDVIEKGFLSGEEKITSGVGAFRPNDKQVQALVEVTKKQLANPNYKRKLPKYDVGDEDIDIALSIVKNRLGDERYKKWVAQVKKSGAVDNFLTTGENGKKRFKAIVRKYLETGGRSAITGEFVPFNHMQLDHRVPFASAAVALRDKKRKRIKTTIETEKAKLDSPENWDLMETPINQFKNSLTGNDLIEKGMKQLSMTPDEKELLKIKDEIKTIARQQLYKNLVKAFSKGDYSGFTEESIGKLNKEEQQIVAKAWNYFHPDLSERDTRDYLKADPNYPKKLKALGIDINKKDPTYIVRYKAQIGGSRSRSLAKKGELMRKDMTSAMKRAGVISSKKQSLETDTALAKAILGVEKKQKSLKQKQKDLAATIKNKK